MDETTPVESESLISVDPSAAGIPPTDSAPPDMSHDVLHAINGVMRGEYSEATSHLLLKVVLPAGLALLALVVTYFVAKLVSRWIAQGLCKQVDKTLGRFAGKFTFYSIMVVAGLAILQTAGFSITSFAAIMAAAGFAIGLAFQGTLSNFASGILLLVFRPFKVGDVITAGGVTGKVNEIDLFTTTFDTPDNRRLIVPNSSIAGATIENVSYHKERRVDVVVGVAYAASLDATRAVLTSAAESLAEKIVLGEGRGYQILLSNLGASSVDWTVRVWTATPNFFAVKEALTCEIKHKLDQHGIEIPFPQMQLHYSQPALAHTPESGANGTVPTPKSHADTTEGRSSRVRPRVRG